MYINSFLEWERNATVSDVLGADVSPRKGSRAESGRCPLQLQQHSPQTTTAAQKPDTTALSSNNNSDVKASDDDDNVNIGKDLLELMQPANFGIFAVISLAERFSMKYSDWPRKIEYHFMIGWN